MMKAFVLAKKDISSYFRSWLGVVVFASFVLMMGALFFLLIMGYNRLSIEAAQNAVESMQRVKITHFVFGSFFVNMSIVLIFLIPMVSMKAFSEERKNQTLELLFTYPLSDLDIVLGKFLALLSFFFLLSLPTFGYVGFLHWTGVRLDWGSIIVSYGGFILLGCAYLAFGLFVSSLGDNQVITALVTFCSLSFLAVLDWLANVIEGPFSKLCRMFSPLAHYRDFTFGVLDLTHVAFFVFFCLYFLFMTLRSIETRNWKG